MLYSQKNHLSVENLKSRLVQVSYSLQLTFLFTLNLPFCILYVITVLQQSPPLKPMHSMKRTGIKVFG
jgi:hypothetical protein